MQVRDLITNQIVTPQGVPETVTVIGGQAAGTIVIEVIIGTETNTAKNEDGRVVEGVRGTDGLIEVAGAGNVSYYYK